MDTFENVHVFSQTTAEISQEYIDKFHESEIVPNYLHELSQKAGVELVSRDGVYEVKGSWLSVNRAHSFLGKFLLTYGQTRVDTVTTVSEHSLSKEEEEGLEFLNRKTLSEFSINRKSYKRDSSDSVDKSDGAGNSRHIDQHLPLDKMIVPKAQPRMPPEPVVLYAGYQVSKEVESRRKTLEVLKNVYKMEQNYQIGVGKDNVNIVGDSVNIAGDGEGPSREKASEQSTHEPPFTRIESTETDSSTSGKDPNCRPASEILSTNMNKIKDEDSNKSDSSSSGAKRTISSVKVLSKEETAAKRKKVESIAENILSNVPMKETVNVVSIDDTEKAASDETPKQNASEIKTETLDSEDDRYLDEEIVVISLDKSDDDARESDFKDDPADKDYSGDTEIESADDEKKATSDNDYIPDEKVVVSKIKVTEKRTTRRSKTKQDLTSLATSKRGRGRSRKGFPMKLEVKLPTKSPNKGESKPSKSENLKVKIKKKQPSGAQKRRGRPKKTPSDVPKQYNCNKCPYFANKRCHLREHERRVHITKEFKCEHCDKIFGFGKDLRRHLKTHLKPQNCCDICGKLYKGVKSLVEHRRTHDDGYVKPEFECEICKKNFSTKYVLAYHIKSEHLGMKRTFMCPTCGKSFSQKNSYLQHANVHMGFKPYKCEICGKAFSYEKSLKEHRFMHDDIRRFKCPVCEKTFRQSSAVTIHMKVHKETKDYVCMACGKGFSQKQALIRHERIHLGEKPFSCGLCGRNFTDSSILRRHMILIHKKDPKKWREDTINNTVRRTDFFIDVLPELVDEDEKALSVKDPEVHMGGGVLNMPHPDLLIPSTSTPSSEPINMTTQSSSQKRELGGEFHGEGQNMPGMEPEHSAEHPYHLPISQVQSENVAQSLSPESVNTSADHKITTLQNHSTIHPGAGLHHQGQSGLQGQIDGKSEASDYLPSGLSSHNMQYHAMMGQGGYPYPQMVMMPDPNVQYPAPGPVAFQSQYPDQTTPHQYSTYHPPQS